jgi:lambda family phage minor tail protein L
MATQKANTEITLLEATAMLELFELDCSFLGGPHYYFYNGTNNKFQPVIFNGVEYTAFPLEVSGFEIDGKGSLPRPRLRMANINGFVSSLMLQNNVIIGGKFIRRRVAARFIDAVNFPGNKNPYGLPDPTAAFPDEIFYVNRKITENNVLVEFEMTTPLEIDNVKLPNRQILSNICPFRYRDGSSCGYTSTPVADYTDKPFGAGGYGFILSNQGAYNSSTTYDRGDYVYVTSQLPQTFGDLIFYVCTLNGVIGENPNTSPKWIADSCSRRLKGCRLRFPTPQVLRFGGFPGTSRGNFV